MKKLLQIATLAVIVTLVHQAFNGMSKGIPSPRLAGEACDDADDIDSGGDQ